MENLLLHVTLTNDQGATQNAIMYVTKLQQTNSVWSNLIVTLKKEKNQLQGEVLQNGTIAELYNEAFAVITKLQPMFGCSGNPFIKISGLSQFKYIFDKSKVTINSILRGYYSSTAGKNVAMYQKDEKDSSGEKLEDYLNRIGSVAADLWVEKQVATTTTRKMAFKKKVIDWSKTWNSSYLTQEEKDYLRQTLDLDIWLSNSKRETYQLFSHMIETSYENRDYSAIGLHGNFGSGKSEMIKCYAAEHDAPMLYIACSDMLKIQSIFAKVGPVLINNKAELTIQQTILLKCFIHNLPLIVGLDEFNLLQIKESNALAPIITENKLFVDAMNTAYKNDGTIIYVGCWNPDTANAKSLDGKMYDRLLFLNVEDLPKKLMKEYKKRKQIASLFGLQVSDYTDKLSKLPQAIQDKIKNSLTKNPATSKDALDAYIKAVTATPSVAPVKDKFVPHHVNDITLDTPEQVAEARDRMEDLFEKVNGSLYQNTKGIDTKNPNRNFAYYIPERATDYFCDLIMMFSNVEKALDRGISDLLPGGGTLRVGIDAKDKDTSRVDKTPYLIAEGITTALSTDIDLLNVWLFDANSSAAQSELQQQLGTVAPIVGWTDGCELTEEQSETLQSDEDIDSFINKLNNKK